MEISELKPAEVWRYFEQLTRIPRPSGGEGRVVEWLKGVAEQRGLEWRADAAGNITLARIDAEGRVRITLQAHLDMVCERRSGVEIDFERDPIDAYVESGWVRARGTTLGADCGIGVAAALAVLCDEELSDVGVEALFTVDEERGLSGAFGLGEGMIAGEYLLNLDSEDEGEIFIGCAGGVDTTAQFPYRRVLEESAATHFRLAVEGLQGGHSGDDIDKGRGNAVKLLAEMVERSGGHIVDLEAGHLRNAIPREGWAIVAVPSEEENGFRAAAEGVIRDIMERERWCEPHIVLSVDEIPDPSLPPIDATSQCNLLGALRGVVNGVIAMSSEMEGLVDTSSNLASVRCEERNFYIVTSQRSSTFEGRDAAAAEVRRVMEAAGAVVSHSDGYPGWKPNPASKLLGIAQSCHKELFGESVKVRAIHAGLECGLFLERCPTLDMISFGPTMRGVHSPDERLEIVSVERFYRLLKRIVESV